MKLGFMRARMNFVREYSSPASQRPGAAVGCHLNPRLPPTVYLWHLPSSQASCRPILGIGGRGRVKGDYHQDLRVSCPHNIYPPTSLSSHPVSKSSLFNSFPRLQRTAKPRNFVRCRYVGRLFRRVVNHTVVLCSVFSCFCSSASSLKLLRNSDRSSINVLVYEIS
jgi:hypothetical protein